MKGINKEKIESLQPSQGRRPMNQRNKFSPEINKHDISAGSHRTGRACCRSCKVEGAQDRKIKKKKSGAALRNQESGEAGRSFYGLSNVMKTYRKKTHKQALEQDFTVGDIRPLPLKWNFELQPSPSRHCQHQPLSLDSQGQRVQHKKNLTF